MHAIGRPYGMILVTGPTGSGKTVSLYTCLNILNQPGVNISTAEDPAEIQLARRQPGQHEREGGAHVRRRAPGVPAAGSGHHHGRRNPRPRDRRNRDQGGADGPPRAVDAAHQRRADHAAAAAQHGRRAVQRRVVGDPDHRAAARPPAVRALQEARGHSARGAAAGRIRRGGPRRLVAALRPGRLRAVQGYGLQGPRRHLPGDADHRRHAPAHHAQRQRASTSPSRRRRKACAICASRVSSRSSRASRRSRKSKPSPTSDGVSRKRG